MVKHVKIISLSHNFTQQMTKARKSRPPQTPLSCTTVVPFFSTLHFYQSSPFLLPQTLKTLEFSVPISNFLPLTASSSTSQKTQKNLSKPRKFLLKLTNTHQINQTFYFLGFPHSNLNQKKMPNSNPTSNQLLFTLFILTIISIPSIITSKSTIEPCSNSDSCNAMLGYTLYTDLKVSEVASLFGIDPISLLTANSVDISIPDVENHILPSQLFLRIPISCSCVDGIRKSVSTHYKTRPSDSITSISDTIYGGLVSADQLKEANSITDSSVLDVGQSLVVPLPCTCFNNTDNSLPAIYLSYVVQPVDTLVGIAAMYRNTITDLMNVNAMGSTAIFPGDILSVPLSGENTVLVFFFVYVFVVGKCLIQFIIRSITM